MHQLEPSPIDPYHRFQQVHRPPIQDSESISKEQVDGERNCKSKSSKSKDSVQQGQRPRLRTERYSWSASANGRSVVICTRSTRCLRQISRNLF